MKSRPLIRTAAALAAALAPGACTGPAILKISTPAVQARIIGDVEKDLLAGGGALLISGGSTSAAVAAITAQELKNLPALQQALDPQTAPKNPGVSVTP